MVYPNGSESFPNNVSKLICPIISAKMANGEAMIQKGTKRKNKGFWGNIFRTNNTTILAAMDVMSVPRGMISTCLNS